MPLTTPLDSLHRRLGARMMEFAGYDLPVHYPAGLMAEHLHCRAAAALFDVSHMGQATLAGPGAAVWLERLVPGDIAGLAPGGQRYTLFTTPQGGISDDLMVACLAPDHYFLVVNASRKHDDFGRIGRDLPPELTLHVHHDKALLALQGPAAAAILPTLASLPFLAVTSTTLFGIPCLVSRSGYTGEDGFEISCPAAHAETLAEHLLADPRCRPAGLGARDSLRLEAGLCLYGADLTLDTNPIEAGLAWTIAKRRRLAADFAGATLILGLLASGPARRRVGLLPEGRAPARAGTLVHANDGTPIGAVSSGGYSPTLQTPIAMGMIAANHAIAGTTVQLSVRGRNHPARIVPLPFVPHRTVR